MKVKWVNVRITPFREALSVEYTPIRELVIDVHTDAGEYHLRKALHEDEITNVLERILWYANKEILDHFNSLSDVPEVFQRECGDQ